MTGRFLHAIMDMYYVLLLTVPVVVFLLWSFYLIYHRSIKSYFFSKIFLLLYLLSKFIFLSPKLVFIDDTILTSWSTDEALYIISVSDTQFLHPVNAVCERGMHLRMTAFQGRGSNSNSDLLPSWKFQLFESSGKIFILEQKIS